MNPFNEEHADVLPIFDDDGRTPSLADRYGVPPFSVLDARQGAWQARKRQWLGMGIKSEVGRFASEEYGAGGLTFGNIAEWERKKNGAAMPISDTLRRLKPSTALATGTSIFDPVLCELAYRWWCPPGGRVIDPFAGGSVRGLVAARLGRFYLGRDLSEAQVEANREQEADFRRRGLLTGAASWEAGDSALWDIAPASADMIFTCPPYLWLERYSDDPGDLSTMTEAGFATTLGFILSRCARALRGDRFACIVAGDARDGNGTLADMRGITIREAAKSGLRLHSTAVLLTSVATAAVRAGGQFEASRMLVATHQDVLVFCKGDRKRAAMACREGKNDVNGTGAA